MFGCVANQVQAVVFTNGAIGCGYSLNSDCCNFAIAVGVLGFLLCLAFLVKDVLFVIVDYSNNIVVSQYTWWIYGDKKNTNIYNFSTLDFTFLWMSTSVKYKPAQTDHDTLCHTTLNL